MSHVPIINYVQLSPPPYSVFVSNTHKKDISGVLYGIVILVEVHQHRFLE